MHKVLEKKGYLSILLISGVYLLFLGPTLFTRSMFMDGLYYASIARNMAEGLGSFWHPEFTKTHFPVFHEHPPLALWLQSLFFRVFGDHFWVERIYALCITFLSAWTCIAIWQRVSERHFPELKALPLLFWTSIPLLWWSTVNNVLEHTMMLFVLLAGLFFARSLEKRSFLNIALGGTMIFLGGLCKGPVAFFPLAFFFWVFLFSSKLSIGRMFRNTLMATFFALFPLALFLLFSQEAYLALQDYFLNQVVQGVTERQKGGGGFYMLERLFGELIPTLSILALSFLILRWKNALIQGEKRDFQWGMVFVATGLSGVLPIMISKTQGGFYMLPALPLFCIGASFFLAPYLSPWMKKVLEKGKSPHFLRGAAVIVLLGAFLFHAYRFGEPGKDREKLALVEEVSEHTDEALISIDPKLWSDFGMHAYFQRYHRISMDRNRSELHELLLVPKKGGRMERIPEGYEEIPIENEGYLLYRENE